MSEMLFRDDDVKDLMQSVRDIYSPQSRLGACSHDPLERLPLGEGGEFDHERRCELELWMV
jgi:hypothetical protein